MATSDKIQESKAQKTFVGVERGPTTPYDNVCEQRYGNKFWEIAPQFKFLRDIYRGRVKMREIDAVWIYIYRDQGK